MPVSILRYGSAGVRAPFASRMSGGCREGRRSDDLPAARVLQERARDAGRTRPRESESQSGRNKTRNTGGDKHLRYKVNKTKRKPFWDLSRHLASSFPDLRRNDNLRALQTLRACVIFPARFGEPLARPRDMLMTYLDFKPSTARRSSASRTNSHGRKFHPAAAIRRGVARLPKSARPRLASAGGAVDRGHFAGLMNELEGPAFKKAIERSSTST